MKYLLLVTLSLFVFWGQAQNVDITEKKHETKIVLLNGTTLIGELVSYDPNTTIVISISGNEIVLPSDKIKKIVMMTSSEQVNINRLKTKRLYNRTNIGLLSNSNGNGITLNHSVLYQHSRWIGVGLGAGIDNYYFQSGRNVYPVFVEFKSFLVDRNSSPYVSLKSGYGFIFSNEDLGQEYTKGGLIFNPTFGYRIGSSGVFMDFYMGFRFQKAQYEINDGWSYRSQDIQWNRVEIGTAVSF